MADLTAQLDVKGIDRALAACQRAAQGADRALMAKIGLALVTGARKRLGGTPHAVHPLIAVRPTWPHRPTRPMPGPSTKVRFLFLTTFPKRL
jgi:hypothetical protein